MEFFLGITGASGFIIGKRLLEELCLRGRVHLCITGSALEIARLEGVDLIYPPKAIVYEEDDLNAPVASGSRKLDACIVAPCSMGTLSRIACGISSNLIERAADVALKEGWRLVLVPRETPLNAIHLENMLKLSRLGVVILPPVLSFYHHPSSLEDMVDFIVGRALDVLGLEHKLYRRWKEDEAQK